MPNFDSDTYAIAGGGPLCRAEHRLRIARDDRRDPQRRLGVVLVLSYLPLLVVGLRWRAATGAWPLALQELTTHVRVLAALPLLLVAEPLLQERVSGAGRYLLRSRIVGAECLERHRAVVARTAGLRDSGLVEALLLAGAAVSVAAFPAFTRDPLPAHAWGMTPSVFLLRFFALRLLWRWLLWASYLVQLSRLPLGLRATHPDRAAGLMPLTRPSAVLGVAVMAGASVAAARWGDLMRFEHLPASAFTADAVTYALAALLLASAPLWVFTGPLVRLRHGGERAYGALANRYSEAFERRWLERSGEDALGDSDFQALNDLGGSFERVLNIRPVLATKEMLAAVLAAVAAPLLPLLVAEVGALALLRRVARALM